MMDGIVEALKALPNELAVVMIAALPIIELRGAIPVGISLGIPHVYATILAFFGSILPAPFILLLIRPIFNWMKHRKIMTKLVDRLSHKSTHKNAHKIQKYGAWALIPLVAIPLPGTGVWSGSLAAALLNIPFKWALPAIIIGNLIAAIAVLLISTGAFRLFAG